MNFINPIELLEIDVQDISQLDINEIKKAKKKKLALIELSDNGFIEFKHHKVTKSDFLRITDELDNRDKIEFYFFIKSNTDLNNFLTNGDTKFFNTRKQESIYKLPEFIDFVNPYYTKQFSEQFAKAFENENIEIIKQMVSGSFLNGQFADSLYKGVYQKINEKINELHELRNDIENEESEYSDDNIDEIVIDLENKFNVELYNALPNYFQTQRNDFAQKLRNISVAVFNILNNSQIALDILSKALRLEINSLTQSNLRKDYEQIHEINEERKETEKYTPALTKYALILMQLNQIIEETEENEYISSGLTTQIYNLIPISELNSYPEIFDEIRERIAFAIRSLSVTAWNEHQNIELAIGLIKIAEKIKLIEENKALINKAYADLIAIRVSQIKREENEINQIINILKKISSAINETKYSYNLSINFEKVKEHLEIIFSDKTFSFLENSTVDKLKLVLVKEVEPILISLKYSYSYFINDFIEKLESISNNSDFKESIELLKEKFIEKKTTTYVSSNSSINNNQKIQTTNDNENTRDIVLLILGIISWIGTFSVKDGTTMAAIFYASFFLFFLWYTPYLIYKLIKKSLKKD